MWLACCKRRRGCGSAAACDLSYARLSASETLDLEQRGQVDEPRGVANSETPAKRPPGPANWLVRHLPPLYRGDPAEHYEKVSRAGVTVNRSLRIAAGQFIAGAIVVACLLPVVPPTAYLGSAGWALAIGAVLGALAVGVALVRIENLSAEVHLAAEYFAVLMVGLIAVLSGGPNPPYLVLLVFTVAHVAVHPLRRTIPFLLTVTAVSLAPLLYANPDSADFVIAVLRVFTILGVGGGFIYLIGNVYDDDATLRAEAERARAEAETAALHAQRLQEVDTMKDRFVATVSHELRTPLTSIKGYVEALTSGEDGELTGDQREDAEAVYRNAVRLEGLISDLLLLSQIEAGSLMLERERFDVASMLAGVVAGRIRHARERGIELRVETAGRVEVLADRRRIEQTLANLVSNAIKYSLDAPVIMSARVEGGEAVIQVADEGIGIPPDELPRIGERFFRASTVTSEQGTGLGLAITREILELHGGRLEINSAVGVGSTFSVHLPVA
jgi:signal transduction histidine kinase